AEANAADAELAVHRPRPAAQLAARMPAGGKLGFELGFCDFRLARHEASQRLMDNRCFGLLPFTWFVFFHRVTESTESEEFSSVSSLCVLCASVVQIVLSQSFAPSVFIGTPSASSSILASSSLSLVVTMATFMPCTCVYLSGLSSGNTSCSE